MILGYQELYKCYLIKLNIHNTYLSQFLASCSVMIYFALANNTIKNRILSIT